ncbi:hypothetical protein B296_00017288 [Ensete ventricosum]|uniref:Uncharacterized protein n=1 Tax=Ensete ventricosum TaxID=4639 RepID=A0A427A7H8_ENSVE|nr:hypothetical protein B296_00017288 [Ensete ventricosum]
MRWVAGHDLDPSVTEGSLAAIRERYNIPTEYRLYVPQPGQCPYSSDVPGVLDWSAHPIGNVPVYLSEESVLGADRMDLGDLHGMRKVSRGKTLIARLAALTQGVGEAPPAEALRSSSKRSSYTPVPFDDPSRRHKKVKILSRRHKSRHSDGRSRSHSKGKELTMSVEELEGQAKSPNEAGTSVFIHLRSMKDYAGRRSAKMTWGITPSTCLEISRGCRGVREGTPSPATGEGAVHAPVRGATRPSCQRGGPGNPLTRNDIFLIIYCLHSNDRHLCRINMFRWHCSTESIMWARKANDDLLKSVKDLQSTRAELPKRAVDDYKESADFKKGLKRMG